MGIFNTFNNSARLVNDMADRLDVDLNHIGGLSPDLSAMQFRSWVVSCSACDMQDDCRRLLDENVKLDDAPNYCRNREIMHR